MNNKRCKYWHIVTNKCGWLENITHNSKSLKWLKTAKNKRKNIYFWSTVFLSVLKIYFNFFNFESNCRSAKIKYSVWYELTLGRWENSCKSLKMPCFVLVFLCNINDHWSRRVHPSFKQNEIVVPVNSSARTSKVQIANMFRDIWKN